MTHAKPPRQFGLKDGAHRTWRDSPINRTFGPAGEALPEQGFEEFDAAREWLAHVRAGRIGLI